MTEAITIPAAHGESLLLATQMLEFREMMRDPRRAVDVCGVAYCPLMPADDIDRVAYIYMSQLRALLQRAETINLRVLRIKDLVRWNGALRGICIRRDMETFLAIMNDECRVPNAVRHAWTETRFRSLCMTFLFGSDNVGKSCQEPLPPCAFCDEMALRWVRTVSDKDQV